jgi:type II secretory pathway pseudopilin PulG
MTLTELLVVMSVMVILLALALPVAKKLAQSLGEATGARSIIAAAMSNARAIAIREGHYAGVRFQQDISGKQYIVLIIHDPNATGLANGFRAIQGKKPMALPDDVGVLSCRVQKNYIASVLPGDTILTDVDLADDPAGANTRLNDTAGKNDAAIFSVVFNPSGKFVVHTVRVYNAGVNDNVFNSKNKQDDGSGNPAKFAKFRQDEPETAEHDGFQEENSVPSFKIYSKKGLDKVPATLRWTGNIGKNDGLAGLDKEFVNPYTGELVKK